MEQKLFKYLPAFTDADGILCIDVEDISRGDIIKIPYPYLAEIIERFAWDPRRSKKSTQWIALDDLLWALAVYKYAASFKDFQLNLNDEQYYNDSAVCHVCGHVAFPDDEMYRCMLTGKPVCSAHSTYSEEYKGYVTCLIPEVA